MEKMTYNAKEKKSDELVWIAPNAAVSGDVTFGAECSVWPGASVRGDEGPITVGARTNIQECAVLHNTTVVGRGCTIGHGAIVHGCTVGDNTLIGMGAIILDGAKIGSNCIVGAGALVTGRTEIPDGTMALGSPAKVIRPLKETEIHENEESAQEYIWMMESHRAEQQRREQEKEER